MDIYTLRSPIDTGDASLPVAVRDDMLIGANDGCRYLFDLGFPWCYPGGPKAGRPAAAAPANGATVRDVSEHANGGVVLESGQAIAYNGGGFDYSNLTKRNSYLPVPASVAADIWSTVNGASQRFLVSAWIKLPASADWNSESVVYPMLSWTAVDLDYTSGPELLLIGQSNINKYLTFRRMTAAGTVSTLSLTPANADFGTVVQIGYYRTADASVAYLRSANGVITASAAAGSDSTVNFSALQGKFGPIGALANGGSGGTLRAGHALASKYRLYRGAVENLARSGRDPVAVLNADWDRVQARIAASAAANGGNSLIFV